MAVKHNAKSCVPELLKERREKLEPVLKYFRGEGYEQRERAGTLSLYSEDVVIDFYLDQSLRVEGREHLVEGIVRSRRVGPINSDRNFIIDTRKEKQAIKILEGTLAGSYVTLILNEETGKNLAEP